MRLGHISLLDYELHTFPERLRLGLAFLRETDFSRLPPGRIDLQGDALFALVQDYVPEPRAQRLAEAHARYTDIQFLAAGEEYIGYAPRLAALVPSRDHLAERDVAFYTDPPGETALYLPTGAFAVFSPWDIHRPGCESLPGRPVRKIVLKADMTGL